MMSTQNNLNGIFGLAAVEPPNSKDVIMGRGGLANGNNGNKDFLQLVALHEEAYMNCQRKFQKIMAITILHQLRVQGVRFVEKDRKSDAWCLVSLARCRKKISQALREKNPFRKLAKVREERTRIRTVSMDTPVTSLGHNLAATLARSNPIKKSLGFTPSQYFASVQNANFGNAQVTDASSDEEEGQEEASLLSGAWSMSCQMNSDVHSSLTFDKVFDIPFYPVDETSMAKKRGVDEASQDWDSDCCCNCTRKKRRKTVDYVPSDITDYQGGLESLDDIDMGDFLGESGMGLDDLIELCS